MADERFEEMSDEEMIEFLKNDGDSSEEWKKIKEALARIVVAMRKKGIDCGIFAYWWEDSFWLTNCDQYKHLGKIHDYGIRYSSQIINPEENG